MFARMIHHDEESRGRILWQSNGPSSRAFWRRLLLARGLISAAVNTDRAPATARSRSATPALQRAGLGIRRDRQDGRRYFKTINEHGGINGRKINFISRDDGYSPPKTVEQVRQLVEQEQVLFLFNTVRHATNAAIQGYLNENKVPQLSSHRRRQVERS